VKQYHGSVLSNGEDDVMRVNSNNYSDQEEEPEQAPVVIEELEDEYRSNEDNNDFGVLADEPHEKSPDFEGLR
jgi:hypothetical protein